MVDLKVFWGFVLFVEKCFLKLHLGLYPGYQISFILINRVIKFQVRWKNSATKINLIFNLMFWIPQFNMINSEHTDGSYRHFFHVYLVGGNVAPSLS